jgi:hypothetical protein
MAARATSTKPKKPMGRPTVFTPENRKAIIDALEGGCYIEDAVAFAGISRATYYSWMDLGVAERDRLLADNTATPNPALADYLDFSDTVERARAKAVVRNVGIIQKAALTTWQAAAWWLERTRPKQFGRQMLEVTGADGGSLQINVSTEDLERKVDKILTKRATG